MLAKGTLVLGAERSQSTNSCPDASPEGLERTKAFSQSLVFSDELALAADELAEKLAQGKPVTIYPRVTESV